MKINLGFRMDFPRPGDSGVAISFLRIGDVPANAFLFFDTTPILYSSGDYLTLYS